MKFLAKGIALAAITAGSAIAQVPAKPSGTMRVEADHREFTSQIRTTEWQAPATGTEGFTTYFPDGLYVTTMKLKNGAVTHNLGSYRIAGDSFCPIALAKTRMRPGTLTGRSPRAGITAPESSVGSCT